MVKSEPAKGVSSVISCGLGRLPVRCSGRPVELLGEVSGEAVYLCRLLLLLLVRRAVLTAPLGMPDLCSQEAGSPGAE